MRPQNGHKQHEHQQNDRSHCHAVLAQPAPGILPIGRRGAAETPGLVKALYDVGVTMNDVNPDYVIVGETTTYNYENIVHAASLVMAGARLIGTNPDMTGPSESGIIPATRALIAPIELASSKNAYFVGKPNPLMMRTGLKMLGCHSAEAVMIGDRMDTDIIAGIETGVDTVLVLSGCTAREDVNDYPYRPTYILDGVGDVVGA